MKNTLLLIGFVIISLFAFNSQAQEKSKKIETTEFKVWGVCGQCKDRIENAALIKGVKFAEWNKQTQMLKVIYVPEKVSLEKIHKAVAEAGHDTELVKADDEVYKKLPKCCLYRDGIKAH
jgi:periplasmic mercuric ion binding protein